MRVSPGMLHDRGTILRLKMEASKMEQDVSVFKKEYYEILEELTALWHLGSERPLINPALGDAVAKLQIINRKIWALEDEVRALPEPSLNDVFGGGLVGGPTWELAKLAKLIAKLNDDRHVVINSINQLYGVESERKIYKESGSCQNQQHESQTKQSVQ